MIKSTTSKEELLGFRLPKVEITIEKPTDDYFPFFWSDKNIEIMLHCFRSQIERVFLLKDTNKYLDIQKKIALSVFATHAIEVLGLPEKDVESFIKPLLKLTEDIT